MRIWVPDIGIFGSRNDAVMHIFYIIIYKPARRCRTAADDGKMRKRDTFGKARENAKARGAYPFENEKKSENRAPGIADRVHISLSLPVAANIARFGIFPLFSLCRKSKSKYAHIIAYNVYIFAPDEKSLHKKTLVGRKNSI